MLADPDSTARTPRNLTLEEALQAAEAAQMRIAADDTKHAEFLHRLRQDSHHGMDAEKQPSMSAGSHIMLEQTPTTNIAVAGLCGKDSKQESNIAVEKVQDWEWLDLGPGEMMPACQPVADLPGHSLETLVLANSPQSAQVESCLHVDQREPLLASTSNVESNADMQPCVLPPADVVCKSDPTGKLETTIPSASGRVERPLQTEAEIRCCRNQVSMCHQLRPLQKSMMEGDGSTAVLKVSARGELFRLRMALPLAVPEVRSAVLSVLAEVEPDACKQAQARVAVNSSALRLWCSSGRELPLDNADSEEFADILSQLPRGRSDAVGLLTQPFRLFDEDPMRTPRRSGSGSSSGFSAPLSPNTASSEVVLPVKAGVADAGPTAHGRVETAAVTETAAIANCSLQPMAEAPASTDATSHAAGNSIDDIVLSAEQGQPWTGPAARTVAEQHPKQQPQQCDESHRVAGEVPPSQTSSVQLQTDIMPVSENVELQPAQSPAPAHPKQQPEVVAGLRGRWRDEFGAVYLIQGASVHVILCDGRSAIIELAHSNDQVSWCHHWIVNKVQVCEAKMKGEIRWASVNPTKPPLVWWWYGEWNAACASLLSCRKSRLWTDGLCLAHESSNTSPQQQW